MDCCESFMVLEASNENSLTVHLKIIIIIINNNNIYLGMEAEAWVDCSGWV